MMLTEYSADICTLLYVQENYGCNWQITIIPTWMLVDIFDHIN